MRFRNPISRQLAIENQLKAETCAELATTKRRKIAERDHSIRTRLTKAKQQTKQPTVAEGKKHIARSKGKGILQSLLQNGEKVTSKQ